MLEKYILEAKHWQIFISLIIPSLIYSLVPNSSILIIQIKNIIIGLAYYSWLYVLGKGLNYCIPRRHMLSDTFLTFNFFFFSLSYTLLNILLDPGTTINFRGVGFLLFLYFLFSYLYLFYFAAKALTSAEKLRRTSFKDHIGEMFLLMIGLIGVWILQPRVNKVYLQNLDEFEDE